MAEKKAAKMRRKEKKDQPDRKREQRAPTPAKKRPETYRFEDWASI